MKHPQSTEKNGKEMKAKVDREKRFDLRVIVFPQEEAKIMGNIQTYN